MDPLISSEAFRAWVSKKLEDFLDSHPQMTVQEIAERIGVSAATISRWRSGQTNIAQEHYEQIFAVLGVTQALLAREHNLETVVLPKVRTRGIRTRGAASLYRGQPAEWIARDRLKAEPQRVLAILINPVSVWRSQLKFLSGCVKKAHEKVSSLVDSTKGGKSISKGGFRLSREDNVLMAPVNPKADYLSRLLDGIALTAHREDLVLTMISAPLRTEKDALKLSLDPDEKESLGILDLLAKLSNPAFRSLLILEVHREPFPTNTQVERELLGGIPPSIPVILAALPNSESHAKNWPFIGNYLAEGLAGNADLNRDGLVTTRELCDFVVTQIQPANAEALKRFSMDSLVPIPRLYSNSEGERLVLSARPMEKAPS